MDAYFLGPRDLKPVLRLFFFSRFRSQPSSTFVNLRVKKDVAARFSPVATGHQLLELLVRAQHQDLLESRGESRLQIPIHMETFVREEKPQGTQIGVGQTKP